jgi:hypothetical protein
MRPDRELIATTVDAIDRSQDLLFHLKAAQLRDAAVMRRSHALLIAALLAVQNSPIAMRLLDSM